MVAAPASSGWMKGRVGGKAIGRDIKVAFDGVSVIERDKTKLTG